MLEAVVKVIASNPWVYDHIQRLAGAHYTYEHLASQVSGIESGLVLDLGGGTGLWRRIWASEFTYVCLDMDILKVQRFLKKNPDCSAILADAIFAPIKDKSIDVVVCIAVSHHLSDISLVQLISEIGRILKANGTFLFLDAVWAPERWLGRLLWKYDRGSYPRKAEHINSIVSQRFRVIKCKRYTIHHEYVLYRAINDIQDAGIQA